MAPVVVLKAAYISPRALVNEYTRSIGRGSVVVPARRRIDVGTRIVFEMSAIGLPAPVTVQAEVVQVHQDPAGAYYVAVQYLLDDSARAGVMDAAARLLALQQFEQQRTTPRIPVNLPVILRPQGDRAVVADLSLGGMRVVFPAPIGLPRGVGRDAVVEVTLGRSLPHASAVVAWCRAPPAGVTSMPAAVGLRFTVMRAEATRAVERMLTLVDFGPRPAPMEIRLRN